MAVLGEAISVIVRTDAIKARYPGGWLGFRDAVPNLTLASDNKIARVGFMVPEDVKGYIDPLEANGLVFLRDGTAQDIVVADQQAGITTPCDWLEFGQVTIGPNRIAACQTVGCELKQLFTPDGWIFEGSLSQTFGFVPQGSLGKAMDVIGHKDGIDIYRSQLTGKLNYVGRVKRNGDSG
jgi:hypothetical protein